MEEIYIVYEFQTKKLLKGEFLEEKFFVIIDNQKIYKSQFDDLILFGKNVVVITQNEINIEFAREEIKEFYEQYHKERG